MKKVMTKVFMAAAILAGVNVLSSCKDYDEDKYFEIVNGEDGTASLKEYIENQNKALLDLIEKLQKAQESCKSNCAAQFENLNTLIVELQKKDEVLNNLINTKADQAAVEALQNEVNDIKAKVEKNITDIATLQTNVTTIQNDITLINQTLDNLKPRVEKNEQDIAGLVSDVATINSTIITVQSDITTLQGDVTSIKGDVTSIKGDITTLKNQITTINQTLVSYDTRITKAQKDASDALALANSNKTYIENVEKALNDYKTEVAGKFTAIDTKITTIENSIITINSRLDNLETAIETLKADLQNQINALAEESLRNFQTAIAIANQLEAQLRLDMFNQIARLEGVDNNLIAEINDIKDQLAQAIADYKDADADLQAQLDALDAAYKAADADQKEEILAKIEAVKEELQGKIDALDAAYKAADADLKSELIEKIAETKQEILDILNPQISDLQDKYTELVNKDTELQNQINTLDTKVQQNTADILANTQKIDDLTGRVTDLKNALNKMVTGIIVQGTYNPVYGTFALPVGVQSNVLMAFVGKTTEDVTFPTTQTGNYAFPEQALTEAEATVIGSAMESYFKKGGKDLLSSTDDNAGTLYVTVNPNTVDFTGATLKLENSQAKSAGVELLPLEKTDDVLTFGYTRAADNGFYAAKAHIDPSKLDQVQKIDINKSRFKETAANLLKNRTFNFGSFANAVYDELNGILDANAVVAEYTNVDGKQSKVSSQFNLAATAIHPLSFAFAKDFAGRSTLPGFERLENFIDRAANAVNSRIHSAFDIFNSSSLVTDIANIKINHITIDDLDEETLNSFKMSFNINKTFDLGGKTVKFDIDKDVSIDIAFNKEVELNGITATCPTVNVSGHGEGADLFVPITNEAGDRYLIQYTELGEENLTDVTAEQFDFVGQGTMEYYTANGWAIQVIGRFPQSDVNVSGTAGPIEVEINGQTFTLDVNETITTNLKIEDLEFTIPDDGTFSFTVDETFDADFTDAIKDLWKEVQNQIGGVNDMLDQFQNILNDVNNLLDKINNYEDDLTSTVTNWSDKVKEYLQKFNDKGISIINGIIARMQPCLLVSTPSGAKMGVNSKSHPTVVNSTDVTLFPTSYTAEIVTPAFKKHIACVEALDKNGNQEMSEAARVNKLDKMNTVKDGADLSSVKLQLKSGYTYHFTYSALDYSGKICVKRAWVRVK